jgi:hypothetical protein
MIKASPGAYSSYGRISITYFSFMYVMIVHYM